MLLKTYILINFLAFVIFQEEKVWLGRNKVLQISDFYLGHCKKYFPQRLKKKILIAYITCLITNQCNHSEQRNFNVVETSIKTKANYDSY